MYMWGMAVIETRARYLDAIIERMGTTKKAAGFWWQTLESVLNPTNDDDGRVLIGRYG